MSKATFTGLIPPLLTPLLPDDKIDRQGVQRLIEHILAGGGSGVFALGSSGEGPFLSLDQRRTLVQYAAEILQRRGQLLVGISECSVRRVREVMAALDLPGVDAFVLTLPFYGQFSQSDIQRAFFKAIADESNRPLLLYNIPQAVHAVVEPETLAELSQHPRIVGVKDSYGDVERFQRLVWLSRETDLAVLQGAESVAGLSLLAGADGLVCGLGNLVPAWFTAMIEAARTNQAEQVSEVQQRIVALGRLHTFNHWLSCLKTAASLLGLCQPLVSAPMPILSADEVAQIRVLLQQQGMNPIH
ncbi:MAG: dihydrodipicolinate synthase family protein [Anaerolineales bacterium]|nr:dihydrodipicolinate synthase family protein [Anaerolineales bacterium]